MIHWRATRRYGPEPTFRSATLAFLALLSISTITCSQGPPELDEVQKMAYAVKPAVVRVNAYATAIVTFSSASGRRDPVETGAGGSGTGFIIHPDGLILTSTHVIESTLDDEALHEQLLRNGARSFLQRSLDDDVMQTLLRSGELEQRVVRLAEKATLSEIEIVNRIDLSNGKTLPFTVVQLSPAFSRGGDDLALLRIDARGLPTLSLARGDTRLQESIWIAGYPSVASIEDAAIGGWLSPETDLEPTITSGSITAIRKSVSSRVIYQTDAPVYPGHSGGPAVDRRGAVVGIPVWGHSEADRIRFLVPAATARSFMAETGVELDLQGPFNEAYRGALDAAGKGEWRTAAARLKKADALFPGSPDVRRFLNEAERAGSAIPGWTELAALLAFAAAAMILVVATVRVNRSTGRRMRVPPVWDQVVVKPTRGDRNGDDALSLNDRGSEFLGSFTILNGSEAGRRLALGGSGIRIGRESRYCEIVLSDPKISRLHAEVVVFDGRTMLIDRNSSNGTFVNDKRVERTILRDGDIIYFGGRHAVAVAFTL